MIKATLTVLNEDGSVTEQTFDSKQEALEAARKAHANGGIPAVEVDCVDRDGLIARHIRVSEALLHSAREARHTLESEAGLNLSQGQVKSLVDHIERMVRGSEDQLDAARRLAVAVASD